MRVRSRRTRVASVRLTLLVSLVASFSGNFLSVIYQQTHVQQRFSISVLPKKEEERHIGSASNTNLGADELSCTDSGGLQKLQEFTK